MSGNIKLRRNILPLLSPETHVPEGVIDFATHRKRGVDLAMSAKASVEVDDRPSLFLVHFQTSGDLTMINPFFGF